MKHSTLALVFAAASLALVIDGAAEPTTVKVSKSNADSVAMKACTDAGGTVYTNKDSKLVCAVPAGAKEVPCSKHGILCVAAAQVTTVQSSKSSGSSFRTDPSKACTDAGGEVLTDAAGAKFCLMPKAVTPPPTPVAPTAPTKEPTH